VLRTLLKAKQLFGVLPETYLIDDKTAILSPLFSADTFVGLIF